VSPPSNLPDYVERGGEQVWRPPFSAREADLYGFVVAADKAAIDEMLMHDLVAPSGGAVHYRCAHANVMVTFGDIRREGSLDQTDCRRGYISEREVSIWCLVADVMAGGRLLWYLPYIFTDSEQTISTGREVFGYPKQLGFFDQNFPAALGEDGGTTAVQALAIDPFGPDSQAIRREVISVSRQPGPGTPRSKPSPDKESFAQEVERAYHGGFAVDHSRPGPSPPRRSAVITAAGEQPQAPPPARPPRPWIRGAWSALQGISLNAAPFELIMDMVTNPTLVFLKQFRDVSCSTKACYQAIVEAPIEFHDLEAYEPLDASLFELTFQSWASDPIAEELGIDPRTATPAEAFHAKFGFDIQLGEEVWRAT
jgi:hypothetical protein